MDDRGHEHASHYQGKTVRNTSNQEVDATREGKDPPKEGFVSCSMAWCTQSIANGVLCSHGRDPNAHIESREPAPGSGHVSQSPVHQRKYSQDAQYITRFEDMNKGLSEEMDKEVDKRVQTS
ncbi:uncharacterized protein PHACADRAFT_179012 [Phanerochaete carnosa HHB-10118-sp]|uniref:Uncharacterized protein n=1 Tax=Phanerochaete carnosa (strain HHB-10118-sp) TaxID=650164 RepID=K5UJ57_PHACS|nr:uncharacterized protein PHACADRAFT_179012 [Phanerochaete carnosa HHB-10118-sp]EKM49601.1 hypothetical protein PHACADRAFT_179012 [Phanerochaete carnosa HHB-10118-sp]